MRKNGRWNNVECESLKKLGFVCEAKKIPFTNIPRIPDTLDNTGDSSQLLPITTGIPTGAIAGITICAVVLLIAAVAGTIFLKKRKFAFLRRNGATDYQHFFANADEDENARF